MNFLIVCSSQRTGSTLIADLLHRAGVATGCEEFFESGNVMPRRLLPALGLSMAEAEGDITRYVERIKAHWPAGPGRFLTVKIHRHHFTEWTRHGLDLERHFPQARYLVCNRGDYLKQAVSALKANQTESWASDQKPRRAPVYDFAELRAQIDLLIREQLEWEAYFSQRSIEPYRLTYETLDRNYRASVRDICAWLGSPLSRWQLMVLRTSMKRQRDGINQEWEARYWEDLGRT